MVTVLEKVLIVEDEMHARSGLTELVESWGYRAECAADGMEGLEKAIAWAPAIVVTDLKMPRMDGMELLSRIGELPQRIAVVMLTAQGSIESAVDAMRMGAYDYIPNCRMRVASGRRMSNWRQRGGSCVIRVCWVRWWGLRRR
jgi:DNA-binding NtrC family response regulator